MHRTQLYTAYISRRFFFGLKQYWKLFVAMTVVTVFITNISEIENTFSDSQATVFHQKFKTNFGDKYLRNKPKILLWTPFFGSMTWYEEGQRDFANGCRNECILTDDKSEIKTADAIVFHLSDITWGGNVLDGFQFKFPTYRRPDQVWILYNLEPITMVLGNLGSWQGVFNWTWSYTTDSDVYAPYGQYSRLSDYQHQRQNKTIHIPYIFLVFDTGCSRFCRTFLDSRMSSEVLQNAATFCKRRP